MTAGDILQKMDGMFAQKCRNSISSHAPHVQPAIGYSSPESPDSADGNPILHPKPHAIAAVAVQQYAHYQHHS